MTNILEEFKMKLSFPKEIHEIADIINDAGYSLYSMGGSIRNQVLKMPVNDYDLDTDAPEEVVTKLFEVTAVLRRKLKTIVIIKYKDEIYEMCLITDKDYMEHFKKGDLTINSMGYNISTDEFIDPLNSLQDIKDQILRFTDYQRSICETGHSVNSVIRVFRFISLLGWELEPRTLDAIKKFIQIYRVEKHQYIFCTEKYRQKILSGPYVEQAYELACELKINKNIFGK